MEGEEMINILTMAGILVLLLCGAWLILATYDTVKVIRKETNDTYWMLYDYIYRDTRITYTPHNKVEFIENMDDTTGATVQMIRGE
jgi:hypothetical protein